MNSYEQILAQQFGGRPMEEIQYHGIFAPPDFTYKYNTPLTPEQEAEMYAEWGDRSQDKFDYDVNAAWLQYKAQQNQDPSQINGHGSDIGKKPNHPTFSTFSKWNGADGYYGGEWQQNNDGSWQFIAGAKNMHSPLGLKSYGNSWAADERGTQFVDFRLPAGQELFRANDNPEQAMAYDVQNILHNSR